MIRSIGVAVLLAVSASITAAQPAKQAHPMIPPYSGSTMGMGSQAKAFDESIFRPGPTKDGKFTRTQHVEGKFTAFGYGAPDKRSPLEVFRNYEGAQGCGVHHALHVQRRRVRRSTRLRSARLRPQWRGRAILAARLTRAEGDVYVAMNVQPLETRFVIVEVKPMGTGLVKISADTLNRDIGTTGHVAVHEILFDTGQAVIKPESAAAVGEIAKLLTNTPSLSLHVVGHTDNAGALAGNMDPSKRRAAAVVTALTTTHKVAATRLHADGVGPPAPVASNDNEAGRAKNRRVELVKQ
ncbi:MAG: OmpA family protein [Cyanobacteria bacterium]|nr:OmpA family protein [Cyanobacteriota bacterium]